MKKKLNLILSVCGKVTVMTFICLLTVMACQEKHNYDYFMKHPKELKEAVEKCQTSTNPENDNYCQIVGRAAQDFDTLLTEQQSNPERFGQRILDQEIACSKMREDKSVTANQVTETCDQIETLLAVVGLSSPE